MNRKIRVYNWLTLLILKLQYCRPQRCLVFPIVLWVFLLWCKCLHRYWYKPVERYNKIVAILCLIFVCTLQSRNLTYWDAVTFHIVACILRKLAFYTLVYLSGYIRLNLFSSQLYFAKMMTYTYTYTSYLPDMKVIHKYRFQCYVTAVIGLLLAAPTLCMHLYGV